MREFQAAGRLAILWKPAGRESYDNLTPEVWDDDVECSQEDGDREMDHGDAEENNVEENASVSTNLLFFGY